MEEEQDSEGTISHPRPSPENFRFSSLCLCQQNPGQLSANASRVAELLLLVPFVFCLACSSPLFYHLSLLSVLPRCEQIVPRPFLAWIGSLLRVSACPSCGGIVGHHKHPFSHFGKLIPSVPCRVGSLTRPVTPVYPSRSRNLVVGGVFILSLPS